MSVTLNAPPTRNQRLLGWVDEMVALCEPDSVHWFDGSDAEYELLCKQLVEAGTFVELDPEPSAPARTGPRSDPSDVARVEDRTFICSEREADAGPTNNWKDPAEMRASSTGCSAGSMRGRTMYVVPVQHGPARLAALLHRRRDHRLALRRREHAHDDPRRAGRARRARRRRRVRAVRALARRAARAGRGRRRRGRATPTRSGSSTSPRPARSGRTARATAATRSSARSASRCGSRR